MSNPSARYYFVQLARGYDSPYAHAGGNNDALQLIAQLKMKDLDEIYNSGEYFYRDKSRKMPHNLYTSTDKLVEGAQKKGYKLIPLELPLGDSWSGEDHQDIKLDYGTRNFSYIVTWRYEDGKYHRLINDKAHDAGLDANYGTKIYLFLPLLLKRLLKRNYNPKLI